MKYKIRIIKYSIALFMLYNIMGCEESISTEIDQDLVVVQGFIYADQQVTDISLSEVLPLGSEDTLAPPISNAEIFISKGSDKYLLIPNEASKGFYYYPGNDLLISSGDELSLEVNVNDQKIFSETIVPPKPTNLELDSDTLLVPEFVMGRPPDLEYYSITLTWDNFDNSYYYVVIGNIEDAAEPIEVGSSKFSSRFVSKPSISNEYRVSFRTVTHFGKHLMILYRVNQEYADLYESRDQDSRNLNEPLTNIKNGLGVFSAFASDSVYFNAVQE
ncbi:MAG: DUF4249 family protein [Bacteroidota bacterium]